MKALSTLFGTFCWAMFSPSQRLVERQVEENLMGELGAGAKIISGSLPSPSLSLYHKEKYKTKTNVILFYSNACTQLYAALNPTRSPLFYPA